MEAVFKIVEKDGKIVATMTLDEAARAAAKAQHAAHKAGTAVSHTQHPVLFAASLVTKTLEEFVAGIVATGIATDVTDAEKKKHDSSSSAGDITLE